MLSSRLCYGQEPEVETDTSTIDSKNIHLHSLDSRDLDRLPIRDYRDIIAIQPGVARKGHTFWMRGSQPFEAGYYVDGVYYVNGFYGTRGGNLIYGSIESINYQEGAFSSPDGFGNAGIINIQTKTGGDKLEISAEAVTDEFLREEDKSFGTYS